MDYSQYKQLEFRRSFWTLVGAKIKIFEPTGEQLVGYIQMKAWKLREDIRLYTDESMQREILRIHARNIIDFGATYDVIDSASEQPLFALRRKGLKSLFVRDHWDFFDASGNVIGAIQETSSGLALMRRWIGVIPYVGAIADLLLAFVTQKYDISLNTPAGPALVGKVTHHKNPIVVKMSLDTSTATGAVACDPRLTISATALLSIIDAVKNN